MRIAIQDSWPNLQENAEKEFIKRFEIACEHVGIDCRPVVTSDDIETFEPDVVLVSHEFSRKLTAYPTIGLIWSPLAFFRDDPYRAKSLMSYDGYLAGSHAIRTYLKDLQAGVCAPKPVSDEIFLPTSYETDLFAIRDAEKPSMAYVGIHWDGARHRELFEVLAKRDLVRCYGPPASWAGVPSAYGGYLPFDGRAVIDTLAKHGLALCLHKPEHRAENTPSMRIFEACSVGALPICDNIAFARENLGEIASFLDMSQSVQSVADQVSGIIDWACSNPKEVEARAAAAKTWFNTTWSLEHKLKTLIVPFVEEVREAGRFKARSFSVGAKPPKVECEVVIRTGGRELSYLKRAIASVDKANSAEFPLGVIVVDYEHRGDIKALINTLAKPTFPIRYIESKSTGFRSTALWDGLTAVKAPFVAHMDDDDSVFPNHYRQLRHAFDRGHEANVCYTGVVRIEDEAGFYTSAPNFDGPVGKTIEERRELRFLDTFDLRRLATMDNFIQSNTWMARTAFLQRLIGEDPELVVVEDMLIYLMLAAHGPFNFTGSPTALWHWRSGSSDNSMMAVDDNVWVQSAQRVAERMRNIPFRLSSNFSDIVNWGRGEGQPTASPSLALEVGDIVNGGLELAARFSNSGFHSAELPGLWSEREVGAVVLPLADAVCNRGAVLKIEYMPSFDGSAERSGEISIAGGPAHRFTASGWDAQSVSLSIPAGTASPIVLQAKIDSIFAPADGGRPLGVLISKISVMPPSQAEQAGLDGTGQPATGQQRGEVINRTVLIRSGVARGSIGAFIHQDLVFSASPGVMYVGATENGIFAAASADGIFTLPRRFSDGAEWFLFVADQPESRVETLSIHSVSPLETAAASIGVRRGGATEWVAMQTDGSAKFQDFFQQAGLGQAQLSVLLSGSFMADSRSMSFYFLLQEIGNDPWLEIRPHYGEIWNRLFDWGQEGEDENGRLKRGMIADFGLTLISGGSGGLAPRDFIVATMVRAILVSAIRELATVDGTPPYTWFLQWLLRRIVKRELITAVMATTTSVDASASASPALRIET